MQEALQSGNLTPDLEEKLMNQLDAEEALKVGGGKAGKSKRRSKKAAYDPISGEPMDDEWQPVPWQKSRINNQLRDTTQGCIKFLIIEY